MGIHQDHEITTPNDLSPFFMHQPPRPRLLQHDLPHLNPRREELTEGIRRVVGEVGQTMMAAHVQHEADNHGVQR